MQNAKFLIKCYKYLNILSLNINIAWSHKRAEIGYWLDTDYTGDSYMSEALPLIEEELFTNDFNRIVIHTDVLNYRSANVAIKAGYKLEGVLRQNVYSEPNEHYRDQNIFAKLKSEQKQKKHLKKCFLINGALCFATIGLKITMNISSWGIS